MAPTGLGHGCSERPNPFVERSFWRSHIYWRWEKDLNIFSKRKRKTKRRRSFVPPFSSIRLPLKAHKMDRTEQREREKVQSHPRILCTAFGGIAERESLPLHSKVIQPPGATKKKKKKKLKQHPLGPVCCSSPNARAPSSSCVYVRYFPNSQMGWKSAANWRGDVARPMGIRQRVCCVNNGTLPAIRDRHPRPIVRNWPRWRTGVDATRAITSPARYVWRRNGGGRRRRLLRLFYCHAAARRLPTHTHTRTPPDNQKPWGNFSWKVEEEEVVIPPTDHVTLGRVEIYRPMNHIRNDFILLFCSK